MNLNNVHDTKNNIDIEEYNIEEKKIVYTLKFILLELENLFIEKNKCKKRIKNLQNDCKEIIQLKKQNVDRYNARLKNLILEKEKLENLLKKEDSQSYLGISTFGNSIPRNMNNLITNHNNDNNTSTNSNVNYNLDVVYNKINNDIINLSKENPIRYRSEKKKYFNNYESDNNNINIFTNCNNNNHLYSTTKNNTYDKNLKKNLGNNSNYHNQNIQKLTSIIYKIAAVNDRIDRINNIHESALSEINFSEKILNKQMKNIESSINRIKIQLCEKEYDSFNKNIINNDEENKSYDSIEELRKEFENNLNFNLKEFFHEHNENFYKMDQYKNTVTLPIEETDCNEITNTNNTIGDLIDNQTKIIDINKTFEYPKNIINTDHCKKLEIKIFEKMHSMKKQIEDKDRRLKNIQVENLKKQKLIEELQRKIENRINIFSLPDRESYLNIYNNNDSIIKKEDYYCNFVNDYSKNISLDYVDNKNENNNLVNINKNIYNISLTSKRIYSEKKSFKNHRYKLPPTNKKK